MQKKVAFHEEETVGFRRLLRRVGRGFRQMSEVDRKRLLLGPWSFWIRKRQACSKQRKWMKIKDAAGVEVGAGAGARRPSGT